MFDNPLILYGLIFVAALLLFDTLLRALFGSRRKSTEVKNRLQALKQRSASEQEAYSQLLLRRGLAGRGGEQTLGGWLNQLIAQSGLEISVARRMLYLLAFFLLGLVICLAFVSRDLIIAVVFAVVFSLALALAMIAIARARRIKRFTYQLAPAIDIIVRSLNAGHPVNSAIKLVAKEMPDPLGSEFGVLSDQMTFGLDLEKAMLNMADRVGAPEVNLLTVTISVQKGTGGNLSEILENLSQMIRDRLMIKAKIRAISAEGRATSWVMLAFPFILYFMLNFLVPGYFDEVWASGYGGWIMGVCLFLIFIGMLILRQLVNFDF